MLLSTIKANPSLSDDETKGHPRATSPLEKCSFACHLFLFPIGLTHFLWLVLPGDLIGTSMSVNYYPSKEHGLYLPVTALFLFLATPLLYAAINTLTVASLDSMDAVEDIYTKSLSTPRSHSQPECSQSILPEICDLDPSILVWYPRQGGAFQ